MVEEKQRRKIDAYELLFWIAYIPWITAWTLTSSLYKDMLHPYGFIKIWNVIGAICIMMQLLIKKRSTIRALFLIPFLILGGIIVSHDNGNASFVFYSILLMIGCRRIDFKKIVRVTLLIQVLTSSLVVLSSLIGVIPNNIINQRYSLGRVRRRYCLGYTYATFFPNYLLSIVIELLYLKNGKLWGWIEIICFGLISFFSYKYTDTKTAFYFILTVSLYESIRRLFSIKRTFLWIGYKFSVAICALFSIVISLVYNPNIKVLYLLNSFANQRLRYANSGINKYGITFFGTSITWMTDAVEYNYIDNSYVNILVCYGVFVFIIVVAGMTFTQIKFYKHKMYGICVAIFLWSVRAIVDPQLFLVWFDPFILLCVSGFTNYGGENYGKDDFNYLSIQ